MRISDWSSDVCSSDLWGGGRVRPAASGGLARNEAVGRAGRQAVDAPVAFLEFLDPQRAIGLAVVFLQRVAFMLQLHHRHAPAAARLHAFDVDHENLARAGKQRRSEEQTSELQSLMRISYAVFCL